MTRVQASSHDRAQPGGIDPLVLYTVPISAAGLILLFIALTRVRPYLPDLLLFLLAVIVAELTTSNVFTPQNMFSISTVVSFSVLLLWGSLPAALVSMLGSIIITLVVFLKDRPVHRAERGPVLQRALFNIAALGIPVYVAGQLYRRLGGTHDSAALWANLGPMVAAAVVAEFLNAALVVGTVAVQTRTPPLQVWKKNITWAIPIDLLSMVVGGFSMALGYRLAGPLGLAVFYLPLLLTIYAFRLYVQQSKAQVRKLENDIAERQRIEEQLTASLQEKDLRLKEIHHRVKNNLQVISSLLHLQSTYVQDETTLHVLGESRNRIRSMALVHEELYQSKDLARVDLSSYVSKLVIYLVRLHGINPDQIRVATDIDGLQLSIDTAAPCGLILNELISNAFTHGFPGGRQGEVLVSLHAQADGLLTLTVHDNGVGIPPEVDPERTPTLGLRLVETLVRQLDGAITINREGGTTFVITFRHANETRGYEND